MAGLSADYFFFYSRLAFIRPRKISWNEFQQKLQPSPRLPRWRWHRPHKSIPHGWVFQPLDFAKTWITQKLGEKKWHQKKTYPSTAAFCLCCVQQWGGEEKFQWHAGMAPLMSPAQVLVSKPSGKPVMHWTWTRSRLGQSETGIL